MLWIRGFAKPYTSSLQFLLAYTISLTFTASCAALAVPVGLDPFREAHDVGNSRKVGVLLAPCEADVDRPVHASVCTLYHDARVNHGGQQEESQNLLNFATLLPQPTRYRSR